MVIDINVYCDIFSVIVAVHFFCWFWLLNRVIYISIVRSMNKFSCNVYVRSDRKEKTHEREGENTDNSIFY